MIKREDYLEALDIVERYHRQQDVKITTEVLKLDLGMWMKCIDVRQGKKHITFGKEYMIVGLHGSRFVIFDDNDKKRDYMIVSNQFRPIMKQEQVQK